MDLLRLRKQLILNEGRKLIVYKDSRNNLTVGIGHLVTEEDHLFLGDLISAELCESLFVKDIATCLVTCHNVWNAFDSFPSTVQEILCNMAFNLGETGLRKFVNFIHAVNQHNWRVAAKEMKASLWYQQTKGRAKRLVTRMEQVV